MMAFALQASLLVRYSTPAVADAFCATRLDGDWGRAFGTMPKGVRHAGDHRPRPDRSGLSIASLKSAAHRQDAAVANIRQAGRRTAVP